MMAVVPTPVVVAPRTNSIPWQLPPGATNYCWTLQVSTDMVHWVDMPGACATDPLNVYATNGLSFFRLKAN